MLKKIIGFGVAFVVLFSLSACVDTETPANRIERICGIKLPEEMEVEYNYFYKAF